MVKPAAHDTLPVFFVRAQGRAGKRRGWGQGKEAAV